MPRPSVALFLVLVCGAPLHAAGADPSVDAWVAALDEAALGGPGIPAAGRSLTIGHLELSFGEGTLFPVRAGQRIVGAFFSGKGEFAYTSSDPLEAAVFRTSVKRTTSYKPQAGKIGGAVPALLVWSPDHARGLAGEEGWPAGATPASAESRFAKFRQARVHDWALLPELFLAQVLVDPPAQPAAVTELGAAKTDLVHVYDTLRFAEEELYRLEKTGTGPDFLRVVRYAQELSLVPIGRKRLDVAPPRFRLIDVDLKLTNPEAQTAEVAVRETFEILEPTRVLELWLLSRRIGRLLEFPYLLENVTLDEGKPAPFVHRKHRLLVELPREMSAGERVSLSFVMRGDILYRPSEDSYWLVRGSWIPLPTRGDMASFDYHAVLQVPQPFLPFAQGKTLRRWEAEGSNWAEFRSERPIEIPVALAGRYESFEQSEDDVTIQVHTYARSKTAHMKDVANDLFALLEFYEGIFGEYPFEELKVIEINQTGWAQAPAGVIFITREAFQRDRPTIQWSGWPNALLAHELAHGWWGVSANPATSQDNWLSEATAHYFGGVAGGAVWGEAKFRMALQEYDDGSRWVGDAATMLTANQLSGGEVGRDRRSLLYYKGAYVLHALRLEMGDDAFFRAFRKILDDHRFKPLHTKDAIATINAVAGKDYTDFWNRYLLGTEIPDLPPAKKWKGQGD